jgi:predicted deacylase
VVESTRAERTLSAADGSTIAIVELEGSRPGPTLAVVAGVHGDEVACLGGLWDWLYGADLISGRVIACPVAHPAALYVGTRLGREGADLNRVFPGDPTGSPTQRLAALLFAELLDGVDALLTMHSWSRTGATVPYVECPATGPASAIECSVKLARSLGVAYVETYAWEPGLLPAAAVARGVPAVELEVGGLGTATAQGEAVAATAVDRAAYWLGIVEGEGSASVTPALEVRRHWLRTTQEGIVRHRRLLGDDVSAGEVVAEVREQTGRVVETLAAPVDGVVAIHLTYGYATAGSAVAVIFEPT